MLVKIIKHELKATARIFLLMYAIMLALTALNSLIYVFSDNILSRDPNNLIGQIFSSIFSASMSLYMLALLAVGVITTVIIVVRFYRMLGDEGYLWFTLPVTAHQHIIGKLVVATLWSLASGIVICLSFSLLMVSVGQLDELIYLLQDIYRTLRGLNANLILWIIVLIVYAASSFLMNILKFYTSVSIGSSLMKSRLGGSVLFFFIISFALSFVDAIVTMVMMAILANSDLSAPDGVQTARIVLDVFQVYFGVMSLYALAKAAGFYILTQHFTAKKLNLP